MLDKKYETIAAHTLARFGKALEERDVDAAVGMLSEDCYWRDLVIFTWNIKTMEGPEQVREMLRSCLREAQPLGWHIPDGEVVTEADGVVESPFAFETQKAMGYGRVRIKGGRIWTLLTALRELKGHEERKGRSRQPGLTQGVEKRRRTWQEKRETELAELGVDQQPYVVIVGGGQGGIALGARLRQLDVPTIILERNQRPGDSWRKRYKTLTLQDPVWYDHLPYVQFPENWPIYSPKDKLGDWLEMYCKVMELNYWGSTEVRNARYDDIAGQWTVLARREGRDIELRPKHLVLATGMSGKPHMPKVPGMERFQGDQHHSADHPGPDRYAGKRAVVVGSNNSAHDIAQALWEMDADVTIVQRSSTLVVKQSSLMEFGLRHLYSEDALAAGVTVEKADIISASMPYALLPSLHGPMNRAIRENDKAFYEQLRGVGFKVDWGDDGNIGIFAKYLSRGSGYYIDIGASDLIIDGSIKLKGGTSISEIRKRSILFSDGAELPADLIVYATGYESMVGWAAELIGPDVAEKIGPVWGLGSGLPGDPGPWEGELRNMWKPTRQAGLWFHGGNLAQSRFYSQFLALQLKARKEGIAMSAFGLSP